jgi:hypothetical protein
MVEPSAAIDQKRAEPAELVDQRDAPPLVQITRYIAVCSVRGRIRLR